MQALNQICLKNLSNYHMLGDDDDAEDIDWWKFASVDDVPFNNEEVGNIIRNYRLMTIFKLFSVMFIYPKSFNCTAHCP